jgi:hypothetical protein
MNFQKLRKLTKSTKKVSHATGETLKGPLGVHTPNNAAIAAKIE